MPYTSLNIPLVFPFFFSKSVHSVAYSSVVSFFVFSGSPTRRATRARCCCRLHIYTDTYTHTPIYTYIGGLPEHSVEYSSCVSFYFVSGSPTRRDTRARCCCRHSRPRDWMTNKSRAATKMKRVRSNNTYTIYSRIDAGLTRDIIRLTG